MRGGGKIPHNPVVGTVCPSLTWFSKNVPFLLSQVCVVSVLKEILPEKNTSHTPLHVIWAISFFKSVKIKKGGQHAQPVHQVWQLLHFLKNVKINLGRMGPKIKGVFSGKISFIDVQGLGSIRITINGVSLCTFYGTCQGSGKVSFATIACQTFQEPGNPELTGRRRLPPNVGKWRASLQS